MNLSNNTQPGSQSSYPCRYLHPSTVTEACLITAYFLLFLAACLENSFVIYLARTCKELKQSTFNYLIINMAVADVLGVVFATVVSVTFLCVRLQWIPGLFGNISCKFVHFLFVLSIGLSISTLVIMSVDRYLAIVHTMRMPMSPSSTKRCIAASWVISTFAASPYLYKMETQKIDHGYVCISVWSSNPGQNIFYSKVEECVKFALYYAIPLIAIGSTNAIIGHIMKTRKPIGFSQTQARINEQNNKIFKLLVTVVALFAFCWIFTHVNHLLSVFQLSTFCKLPGAIPLFFFWLSHVTSSINPIVYFIFNNKFRKGLRKVLGWKIDRKNILTTSQENLTLHDMDPKSNIIGSNRT